MESSPFISKKKLIPYKWVFKKKLEKTSEGGTQYKAKLVVKDFTKREGIDYTKIFSPVAKHTSIRILFAIVACKGFQLE